MLLVFNDEIHLSHTFLNQNCFETFFLQGMTFIHDSEFVYHGNLKSTKCLVDSRWVLKIADFGLGALATDTIETSVKDEDYCKSKKCPV